MKAAHRTLCTFARGRQQSHPFVIVVYNWEIFFSSTEIKFLNFCDLNPRGGWPLFFLAKTLLACHLDIVPTPIFVAKLAENTNQYKQTIICLIVIDLLKSNRRRRHKKCFQTFLFLSKFLFTQRELSESYITVDYLGLSLLIQQ